MTSMSDILWLRQEAFRFEEIARTCPLECTRRRLRRLAEDCRLLSMEMETATSSAASVPSSHLNLQAGERVVALRHH